MTTNTPAPLHNKYEDFLMQEVGSDPELRTLLKSFISDPLKKPSPITLATIVDQAWADLRRKLWPDWQELFNIESSRISSAQVDDESIARRLWHGRSQKDNASSPVPRLVQRFVYQERKRYVSISAELVVRVKPCIETLSKKGSRKNWDMHLTFFLCPHGEIIFEEFSGQHFCRELGDIWKYTSKLRNEIRDENMSLENILELIKDEDNSLYKWSRKLCFEKRLFKDVIKDAMDLAEKNEGYCQVTFEIPESTQTMTADEAVTLLGFPFDLTFSSNDGEKIISTETGPWSPEWPFLYRGENENSGVFCVTRIRRSGKSNQVSTPLSLFDMKRHPIESQQNSTQLPKVQVHILNLFEASEEANEIRDIWNDQRGAIDYKDKIAKPLIISQDDDIESYLRDSGKVDPEHWHIFHIIAHGEMTTAGGVIESEKLIMSPQQLIPLLKDKPIKMIVFSFCESVANQSTLHPTSTNPYTTQKVLLSSFIGDFVRQFEGPPIPILIGHRHIVDDRSNRELFREMYKNFFWGDEWPLALFKARMEVKKQAEKEQQPYRAWLAPVMVCQGPSFYHNAPQEEEKNEQ